MTRIPTSSRGSDGSSSVVVSPLAPHTGCRLAAEVLPRLVAIQRACRWQEIEPAEAVRTVEALAGWAGEHLGVVLEYGCGCGSADTRRIAA